MQEKVLWLFYKSVPLIIRAYKNFFIFLQKINGQHLVKTLPPAIFAVRFHIDGFVAQLDRAPDYGSGGLGFESLRDHNKHKKPLDYQLVKGFLLYKSPPINNTP